MTIIDPVTIHPTLAEESPKVQGRAAAIENFKVVGLELYGKNTKEIEQIFIEIDAHRRKAELK